MNHPFSGILVKYKHGDNSVDTRDDELHVNLWELDTETFLDIGVMISDPSVSELIIDCPWQVTSSDITDLGSRILGEQAATAIFNTKIRYQAVSEGKIATLEFLNDKNRGTVELLRLTQDQIGTKSTPPNNITSIPIEIESPKELAKRYLRLRISNIPKNVYSTSFEQKDKNILSSNIVQTIFDFRINVKRGIPENTLISNEGLVFPKFNRIHFFLIIDRKKDLVFPGQDFKSCRSLEDENNWADYIHNNSKTTDQIKKIIRECLGYHWSSKNSEELTTLCKFSHTKSNYSQIFLFMTIAFIVGAIGNGIWNALDILISEYIHQAAPDENKQSASLLHTLLVLATLFSLLIIISARRLILQLLSRTWFLPPKIHESINKKMNEWK